MDPSAQGAEPAGRALRGLQEKSERGLRTSAGAGRVVPPASSAPGLGVRGDWTVGMAVQGRKKRKCARSSSEGELSRCRDVAVWLRETEEANLN